MHKTHEDQTSITKTIVLTSFIWLLVGTGVFHTLFNTRINLTITDECQSRINKLEMELVKNQEVYNRLVKLLPQETMKTNDQVNQESSFYVLPTIKHQPKTIEELSVKGPELETKKPDNDTSEWIVNEIVNEPTNPPEWPGENGKGVVIPEHLKEESNQRFKENEFDIVASDLIALNRTVPDLRSDYCKKRAYPKELPNTSIVIVYHNEGNSTLLRGLTSICNKTPLRYLKEIVLVDDASEEREYLHEALDQFVKTLPVPVKIIRNEVRMGLMRSRLRGANAASGDTITFLDAHIECTSGWIQPLLFEIKKNRKAVVNPIIDVISYENFAYSSGSEKTYGGFDSKFVFNWVPVPKRENLRRNGDESLPLRSPTMAGGLFMIERNYFYEFGAYDEGMDIWGAENIELSLRIWMCGGTLLVLPCSHVGHVFRKKTPYKFPGGVNKIIYKNTRRVIDVWADEYSTYFYNINPDLLTVEAGNLTERIELRKNLQCKSFKWYLENVYPETNLPLYSYHLGSIKNKELNFCLDLLKRKNGEDCGASFCHGKGGNQMIEYSSSKKLIGMGFCLESTSKGGTVKLNKCEDFNALQIWDYDEDRQFIKNRGSGLCLVLNELRNSAIMTVNCDPDSKFQKWVFADPIVLSDKKNNI